MEEFLLQSNYTLQYEAIISVFEKKNILVVNGETLIDDPFTEIKKVEEFLELRPFFEETHFVYPDESRRFPCFKVGERTTCMKKTKGLEHPQLKEKSINYLRKHFQQMMDNFQNQTKLFIKL